MENIKIFKKKGHFFYRKASFHKKTIFFCMTNKNFLRKFFFRAKTRFSVNKISTISRNSFKSFKFHPISKTNHHSLSKKISPQELGVLHGLSLAAKQLHELEFAKVVSSINESIYCNEAADFYGQSLECSLKEAIHSLRLSHRKYTNLTGAIKQTEQLKGKLYRKMTDCILNQPNEWMVLCHGDLWINNLMFRYDEHGDCDAVKFIDLQTLRYTSPAIDLLHFFYTSTEYTVRAKYMDQLIDDYVDSLYLTLQKFDVHDLYVNDVDTLNTIIRQELEQRAMYGLGICMWLLPAVTFHPDNVIDLDQVTMDDLTNENHEKTLTSMQTPEYHTRMRDTIMEFYRKGILNEVL